MLNSAILIKVKQRLNKLASNDFDNIQDWQIIEAFDKAQIDWCRRNLHGINVVKEGDEQSTRRVDDLEVLLTTSTIPMLNKQLYYEGARPADFLQWKRITVDSTNECCPKPKRMIVYLAEEANVDALLRDVNKRPSYEWGETFCTQKTNKIQVYTDGKFAVSTATLIYYRQPLKIQITGVSDPYTGIIATADVISEFKDDLVELMIDEAVKILAGDIESINQIQREGQAIENNN